MLGGGVSSSAGRRCLILVFHVLFFFVSPFFGLVTLTVLWLRESGGSGFLLLFTGFLFFSWSDLLVFLQ